MLWTSMLSQSSPRTRAWSLFVVTCCKNSQRFAFTSILTMGEPFSDEAGTWNRHHMTAPCSRAHICAYTKIGLLLLERIGRVWHLQLHVLMQGIVGLAWAVVDAYIVYAIALSISLALFSSLRCAHMEGWCGYLSMPTVYIVANFTKKNCGTGSHTHTITVTPSVITL